MYPERVVERVLTKWSLVGDCWVSDYAEAGDGYAQVGWKDGDRVLHSAVHRVSWWAANGGEMPDGMHVDHICRTRKCVRPSHLRLITAFENTSDPGRDRGRTATPTGRYCRKGHQLVKGSGRPFCRECTSRRSRDRRRQKET